MPREIYNIFMRLRGRLEPAHPESLPLPKFPTTSFWAREFLKTTTAAGVGTNGLMAPAHSNIAFTKQEQTYLDYIAAQSRFLPVQELFSLLAEPSEPGYMDMGEVYRVLKEIAECANTSDNFGVDKAIEHLINKCIFKHLSLHSLLHKKARNIVFILISWICMLYSPCQLAEPFGLHLDPEHTAFMNIASQDFEEAKNSICVVLQLFGPLLPVKPYADERASYSPKPNAGTLRVPLLNAQTIRQVGNINVRWVSNVSSHLTLDIEKKILMLYALPSFCHIYRFEQTTFSRIISNYYDQYSRPDKFSVGEYFREIRLSYRLIFGDDSRARKYYKSEAPHVKKSTGVFDPYLDELCQTSCSADHARNSYSTETDFPIFAARLLRLQEYIERQDPGTIVMLWRDRRDMLRWYTFWVVTIIGGIALVTAIVQMGLGAAQVYYSIPSNKNSK